VDTTEQIAGAIAGFGPELASSEGPADHLAREVRRTGEGWGHGEHVLVLEQVTAFGDPPRLRCLFWCESCHVSQHVMLQGPSVQ